ncbi:MAG: hypothetical protein ACKOOL_11330 [Novosphingobium sp.]
MAIKPRKSVKRAAQAASEKAEGVSPNPATNLLIADLALRGGGQLLRHAIERTVLGAKYTPDKAKKIVKGRSMVQTLLGTAAARLATRSVPGAIVVGGGLLAKTLYDRRQGKKTARASGTKAVAAQAKRGDEESSDT